MYDIIWKVLRSFSSIYHSMESALWHGSTFPSSEEYIQDPGGLRSTNLSTLWHSSTGNSSVLDEVYSM